MSGIQGSILSLRGPILGSKGPNLDPKGHLESKEGENNKFFFFGRGTLDQRGPFHD